MPINFPDTPSVDDVYTYGNSSWVWDGVKWNSVNITEVINTVSYSATPEFDLSLGRVQKILLTGNVTSSTITNLQKGMKITFIVIQDGTGGHSFVWPTNVLSAMAIGNSANEISVQQFISPDGEYLIASTLGVTYA